MLTVVQNRKLPMQLPFIAGLCTTWNIMEILKIDQNINEKLAVTRHISVWTISFEYAEVKKPQEVLD